MYKRQQGIGLSSISKIPDLDVSTDKKLHLGPQGILVFHDYDEGIKYAKEVGKPIIIYCICCP